MYGENFSKQATLELRGINFYKCLQVDEKAYISGVDQNKHCWLKEVRLRGCITSKKYFYMMSTVMLMCDVILYDSLKYLRLK